MRLPTLALTGTSGKLGSQVARQLSDDGHELRLLVRHPDRAPGLEGAWALQNDYANPAQAGQALVGVETLFMVSAHEGPERVQQQCDFVRAAANAGVQHIVYTSFIGAGEDSIFTLGKDHGDTEQAIRDSGMAFTFLRDNFYADFAPELVGDDDTIRGPAGEGRVAMVARADVAAVAAVVLADPAAHAGATYDLTGPEALTLHDVAEAIAEAWARPVRFVDQTMDEARASRAELATEEWQMEAWISTYTAIRDGELEQVSDDVPRLLGRPATSLAQVLAHEQPDATQ